MGDEQAVLFANEAFYQAFRDRDIDAMDAVWSRRAPVSCVHPGWGPIRGRAEVMESWRNILSNPESPVVESRAASVSVYGDAALVTCFERIDDTYLIASNMFAREGDGWRLVHHQAGPTTATPPPDSDPTPGAMH